MEFNLNKIRVANLPMPGVLIIALLLSPSLFAQSSGMQDRLHEIRDRKPQLEYEIERLQSLPDKNAPGLTKLLEETKGPIPRTEPQRTLYYNAVAAIKKTREDLRKSAQRLDQLKVEMRSLIAEEKMLTQNLYGKPTVMSQPAGSAVPVAKPAANVRGTNAFIRMTSKLNGKASIVTIFTGSLVAGQDAAESVALANRSCPMTFSDSFIAAAISLPSEERNQIVAACEKASPERAKSLLNRISEVTDKSINALGISKSGVRCKATSTGKPGIEVISNNGLKNVIAFTDDATLESIEIVPQDRQGNATHFLKYSDMGEESKRVSYSALDYKVVPAREKLITVRESYSDLVVRYHCTKSSCPKGSIASSSDNQFSFDLGARDPNERKPFGDMDARFLAKATENLERLRIGLAGKLNQDLGFESVCSALNGTVSEETRNLISSSKASKVKTPFTTEALRADDHAKGTQ